MLTELLQTLPSDLDSYRAVGIVWIVVAPDDPRMDRNALKWLQNGEVVKKADFGSLRIYKVVEPDPRTATPDSSPMAD